MHCNAVHCSAMQCNALQRTAMHCNALQCTATHHNRPQHILESKAQSQRTESATHCNTLQHTATHRNTLQHILESKAQLQRTESATYCNTPQHTATHRNKSLCRRPNTREQSRQALYSHRPTHPPTRPLPAHPPFFFQAGGESKGSKSGAAKPELA